MRAYKLIVSLTSISSRLKTLARVLDSLLSQDLPDDFYEIQLFLSRDSYLLDSGCSKLPRSCHNLFQEYKDRLSLRFVPNIGPYRKVLPVLQDVYSGCYGSPYNVLIVTADDDTLYPPSWLRMLFMHYQQEQCIVAFRGRVMTFEGASCHPYRRWSRQIIDQRSLTNVPTGKDGILYPAWRLHPDVLNETRALSIAANADDLWLKIHALLLGTPSYIINEDLAAAFPPVDPSTDSSSLYQVYNQSGGNDSALRSLELYLNERHKTSLYNLIGSESASTDVIRHSINTLLRSFLSPH